MTPFGSPADRSLPELCEQAAERALADASIDPGTVTSLHVGTMAAGPFNGCFGLANALAGSLGLNEPETRRIENTSATGASTLLDAINTSRANSSGTALVVCGEKMSEADTAASTELISRVAHPREYRHGVTLPALAGLVADRYLREYGGTRRDLARVAVKNHANALSNRYAHFRKEIEVSDVVESPPVAEPLRLYDCCPRSDGAAAVVLSEGDDDVQILACESAGGTHAVGDRTNPLWIDGVHAAGKAAYEAAGLAPKAIDIACLHDAFTILEWLELEALGFAERGGGWRLTRDGTTTVDGAFPVNPGGGLKARGHPLGATGLSQVIELVWQFRGDVPSERAVDGRYGLALSMAGFGNNAVCTIVGANQ